MLTNSNPTSSDSQVCDQNSFLDQCRDVMASAGLIAPDYLITDGSLQRCATVGKEFGKDGAYTIHLDTCTGSGPNTLWWQNHRTGASDTFSQTADNMSSPATPAERKAQFERMEADKLRRQEEQEARYAEVAQTAQELWAHYAPADVDHLYLFNKNVLSYGLKMTHDERLVLSIMDENAAIVSLQYIDKDGSKRFLTGGKKAGGFFAIPAEDGGKNGPLCVCEGYATAASVHMATGYACLVAFDAGNLLPLAKMARKKYPNRSIILCADNDVKSVNSVAESVNSVAESVNSVTEGVNSVVEGVSGVVGGVNSVAEGVSGVVEGVNSVAEGVTGVSEGVSGVVEGVSSGVKSVKSSVINVGVVKATAAASAINGLLAIPPAHEGKPTDFNDMHIWRGLEAVRMCVDAADYVVEDMMEEAKVHGTLGTNGTKSKNVPNVPNATCQSCVPDEIIPLCQEVTPQNPYPIEALGVYGDAAAAIAEHVGAPVSVVASSVLGMLSLATQGIANVEHEGRTILLSLYLLSILSSGERKSTVDSIVMGNIRAHEDVLKRQHIEEMKVWDIEDHAYKTAKNNISKGKDYKAIRDELMELGEEPKKPLNPKILVSNVNVEGLYALYQEGRTSLGLITDEGGILFGGTAFTSENKLKSSATFSGLWSSGSADKLRKGEGSSTIQGKRLACHIMAQPIVTIPLFGDDILQEQGFLPRFLMTWPESLKGSRLKTEPNKTLIGEHPAVIAMHRDCRKLLQYQDTYSLTDDFGDRIFETLRLSDEADEVYRYIYNITESAQAKFGEFYEVSNYASRCAEQALRIAGVLTLAEDPRARIIGEDAMRRAATIAFWYLHETKRIMMTGVVDPVVQRAEKFLRWCKASGITLASKRELSKSPIRIPAQLNGVLAKLKEHGYARTLPEIILNGSKCKTAWEILSYDVMGGQAC